MSFTLTSEQQAAVEAFATGESMVLEAGAGTGKTSTLKALANSTTRKGLYIAFNKSVATEAQAAFPANVRCSTAHSLAWQSVIKGNWGKNSRMKYSRQTSFMVASILGISGTASVGEFELKKEHLARIVLASVKRYCYSADTTLAAKHVQRQDWADSPHTHSVLVDLVLPLARKAWADIIAPKGKLKYEHDYYVKEWQLSGPTLDFDFIMVDEAQDSNAVLVDVVSKQTKAQIVVVGDSQQAIYEWRGAIDAMGAFNTKHHLYLTQSFRFGAAIAEVANKWLGEGVLNAVLRISGTPTINSVVGDSEGVSDAILCRTNAGAIQNVMSALLDGKKPALVGGAGEITRFAEAARDLMAGKSTSHPDLCVFQNWSQVQAYVRSDESGSDLMTAVRLVDDYGTEELLRAAGQTVTEEYADVVISTAHKAKGREWDRVTIHTDFKAPAEGKKVSAADGRLAYVAVTRAKNFLDPIGLSWIDSYIAEQN